MARNVVAPQDATLRRSLEETARRLRLIVPINVAMTMSIVTVVVVTLAPHLPPGWAVGWWLLHALPAARSLLRWLVKLDPHSPRRKHIRKWDVFWIGFAGFAWGAAAFFLPHVDEGDRILLIATAASMQLGGTVTLVGAPRAAKTYILALATPYIFFLLQFGTTIGYALAGLAVVMTIASIVANEILHSVVSRNRRLHEENTALYQRIQAAQKELLDIAESSEAFAFCDAQGRLQLWNHRFPALLGLDAAALQSGQPLSDILERAGVTSDLPPTGSVPGELIALPNGRWLRASRRETPQGDQALILIDVTEQQQASAQLQMQHARLEELFHEVSRARDAALRASHAKSTFLANMSHELRTPLNAIIGFSDIVQQKMYGPASPKYDEYVRDINASAHHLLAIIDDILNLARIEANQIVINETAVDLAAEISTSIRLATSQFGRSSSSVALQIAPDLPPLHGDARLVRQIVINLMANALKFSPAGTPIEAGAQLNGAGEIELWVRDHGVGIAPADQARIFEPFEQADMHLSRKHGGVGLGLSLVRAFVAAHHGRISIDSDIGRGTTITATFPASRTGRARTGA